MSACAELAGLLAYPREGFKEAFPALSGRLAAEAPEAADALREFGAFVQGRADSELEESFTQTFDLDPTCALEIGWHLYGEDYKRGEFLVEMRRLMRQTGVPEGTELPDHLSHVLAVLSRLDEPEARALAGKALAALAKMRVAAAGKPYDSALRAVEEHLKTRFGGDA